MNIGSNRSIRSQQHMNAPKSLRFEGAATESTTSLSTNQGSQHEPSRIQGNKAVIMLKILVLFMLVQAAFVVSFLVYFFIVKDQSDDFEKQFVDYATKVMEQFLEVTHLKVWTCYSLSLAYTTEFEHMDVWPKVTLSRFPVRTFGSASLARASSIAFAPLVTDDNRDAWEEYAAESDILNDLSDTLAEVTPRQGLPTQELLNDATRSIDEGIYRFENDTIVDDKGPGPYFPVWQVSPVTENVEAIMYNQMSDSARSRALLVMMEATCPVLSEVFYQDSYDQEKDEALFETRGILYFPVFDSFSDGNVVGATSVEFNWEDNFRHILPAHAKSVICVLENTCGQLFSYKVQGENVIFLGTGDMHDPRYDDMEESTTYDDFLQTYNTDTLFNAYTQEYSTADNESSVKDSERKYRRMDADGCLYSLHVYPSTDFESAYVTNTPLIYAGIVALIFSATAMIFICYDCHVQRRQERVMNTAARANAIVESLFPAMVRERVFQNTASPAAAAKPPPPSAAKGKGMWPEVAGLKQEKIRIQGDSPKKRLKSFLTGSRQSSRSTASEEVDLETEPIADYFPETTVMFADIAGFTAWSSEREPSEVFHLLESVYYAFDEAAKQLGVFKLETIGDCYVAATGLPDPNEDHAIITTRFAFECLNRMDEVTRQLEIALGPGTSDLTLRVGLHSGPVTGGVLRGDKFRFQLFGDTMNTASRMESTGKTDMIQISQATADLLTQAGKAHWLTPREDVVIAKGKGEMRTYWIQPKNVTEYDDSESVASTGDTSMSSYTSMGEDGKPKRRDSNSFRVMFKKRQSTKQSSRWGSMSHLVETVGIKNSRLVDWNAEQLYTILTKVVLHRHKMKGNESTEEVAIDPEVKVQLRDYVSKIESLYREVPYHNFERASHVTMSANKLMKRIVEQEGDPRELKIRTFGLSEDPLVHFAVVFSALILDVDHRGVTNEQLVKERDGLAVRFKNKSVAEQNSIKVAWELLKEQGFEVLRGCIYEDESERYRFRQLVANGVMATDVKEPKLQAVRKKRWESVFGSSSKKKKVDDADLTDRKAKLVIEHVMQAANVAHTMQHWTIFLKWNECLYQEMCQAYKAGRAADDPSTFWYEDELRFFDNHVIPLSKKLTECGVFGDSSDEYLKHAEQNRKEWETKGKDICRERIEKGNENERLIDGS